MAANGQTLNEMARVLKLPVDKASVHKAYKELIPHLKSVKYATLRTANKVYIRTGFDINPNYTALTKEAFDADIEVADFAGEKTKVVNNINNWVEDQTNKKIKNLINEESITGDLEMILINALYFNGNWEVPFDKEFTHKKKFFYNDTDFEMTEMMLAEYTGNFVENKELDCKFLELPYQNNEFIMTFVLPNKKDGLPELENNLQRVLETQNYKEEDVIVTIPKFKIRSTFDLSDTLGSVSVNLI